MMMKLITILFVSFNIVDAFTSVIVPQPKTTTTRTHGGGGACLLNAYVPDGLTPEQYRRIKAKDQNKLGKDLGKLGPRGFISRSMQAWQEANERGQTGHTFAPLGYRQALKDGRLKKENVPYMVRGGSWDNSDVVGAKRLPWNKKDKEYAKGGYKKEQSASILGSGPGFDWTGSRSLGDKSKKRSFPGLN